VNVNVGPLEDTHTHHWYVWLIISIAGTFPLSVVYYMIGLLSHFVGLVIT
jgi:hypothetical protein